MAIAAIIVTMEKMHFQVPNRLIHYVNDDRTAACVKELRLIYAHNEMRINAIDGESNNDKTTKNQTEHVQVCCAATPLPTPEYDPTKIATFCRANQFSPMKDQPEAEETCVKDRGHCHEGSQRKRQRREV